MNLQVPPTWRDVSPNQGTTSLKRTSPTPIGDERNTRNRTNGQSPPPSTSGSSTEQAQQPPDNGIQEPQEALRNILFPTFKNLRKLEVKLTVAKHHSDFLNTLKELNQVPKGLKVKSTVTTAELHPDLYEEWELAHI